MKAVTAAALLAFAAGMLVADESPGQMAFKAPPEPGKVNSPSVSWWASSGEVAKPAYRRIASAAEWQTLWRRLAGDAVPAEISDRLRPQVDFTWNVVVAVYAGTQFGRAAVLPDLLETNDEGVQRVRFHLPVGSIRDQRECTPYVIFLMPRDQKELVLEEEDEGGAQRTRARVPKLPPVGQ